MLFFQFFLDSYSFDIFYTRILQTTAHRELRYMSQVPCFFFFSFSYTNLANEVHSDSDFIVSLILRKRQLVLNLASSLWNKHCLQVSVVEKSFVERSNLLDLLRCSSPWVWAAHFVSTEPVSLTQPPYIRTNKWDAFQFQPVKQRAEERQAIKECAGKEWRKWQVCCSHYYYYCCCCV